MNDTDIQRVLAQGPDRSLDQLESDIWAGEAIYAEAAHIRKRLTFYQLGVSALVVVASIGSGVLLAGNPKVDSNPTFLNQGMDLAPSTLLAGLSL